MKTLSVIFIGFLSINLIVHFSWAIQQFDDNVPLSLNEDTLIFAHVLYRHGDANIGKPYPNDPYKDEDEYWSPGFSQLTKEGKRQHYRLGQYFRRRYNKILGDKYSYKKVYVQSTDVDRTIESAQVNLAGLFNPTKDEIWNDEIRWNPIPVHTVPKDQDYILYGGKDCPKYFDALEKYLKESAEVQRIYTEYADVFSELSEKSGMNITKLSDVYSLHKVLFTEKKHNFPLADWAEKAVERNGIVEYISAYNYKTFADTKQLARVESGWLLKEIIERFYQKVNSTLQPDRTLWLYSAHNLNIATMLNSLGMFEVHLPPHACSIHFELYKTVDNVYYVQIVYRKTEEEYPAPMNIPGCGIKCPLNKFYHVYRDILPDNFDDECLL